MNIIIVEDEPLASRMVVQMLARVAPEAAVVAELSSVAGLTRWLGVHRAPDLILADIELEDGRVFDAFASSGPAAPIVFITAYDRFLVDAFRTHGIAYLIKPLQEDELAAALAKYEDLRRAFASAKPLALPRRPDEPLPYRRYFTVSCSHKIQLVPHEQVAIIRLGLTGIDVIDVTGVARAMTGNVSLADIEASLRPERSVPREPARLADLAYGHALGCGRPSRAT
jgi:DNA-binding LytR/AlgR family response regulator